MKSDKKILKSASMVAGALLTTTLAVSPASGMDILAYNDLGSGSQVRSHLIDANQAQGSSSAATAYAGKYSEMKCGEEGKTAEAKKGDAKAAEGTDAKGTVAEGTAAKSTEGEAKKAEAKCGEGTCGEGDKKESTVKSESESKSKEAKCGEGKCG